LKSVIATLFGYVKQHKKIAVSYQLADF